MENNNMSVSKFLNKKIIIFGSSREGRLVLDILNLYNIIPCCYIDNHSKKIGLKIGDIPIKPVSYINELDKDEYIVLIPSMYYEEMYKQLLDMKIPKTNISNIDIYYKPLNLFDIPYKMKFYFFMHKYFMKK